MVLAVLSKRGQITVEFILIVSIGLIYIAGSIWPLVDQGAGAAEDVKAIADAKLSSMKLAKALNEAAISSGDMKKTFNMFLGPNTVVSCDLGVNPVVDYEVTVSYINAISNPDMANCVVDPPAGDPTGWKCDSYVELLSGIAVPGGCPVMQTGAGNSLFRGIVVEKTAGIISVSWA